ncbi:EEF1A lysine methyltransferase 1 [Nowakowskiella sp. JEL0078]|nr:EEF1A lysine methyltransferase 1 [Nowakowskiella sp. JEL0078]
MNSDSDDELTLSADTMAALQDFLQTKKEADEKLEKLKSQAENEAEQRLFIESMDVFKEDWQLSQFWYDDDTANTLANEAIANTPEGGWIACLSSPTAFVQLEECFMKTSQTIRKISKPTTKFLVCTGAIMAKNVEKEISAKLTNFEPKHRGGLSNEFRSYLNYESANEIFSFR